MDAQHSRSPSLHWLPPISDFNAALSAIRQRKGRPAEALMALRDLATHRLDFIQTCNVDRALTALEPSLPPDQPRLRLSLQGSATLNHLAPGIRIGALRRGLMVDVHVGGFGQWRQEILDPDSALHRFQPHAVLLMVDRAALVPDLPFDASADDVRQTIDRAVAELKGLWRALRERVDAIAIQQTVWSNDPDLFGHFERLIPAAPKAVLTRLNTEIADAAAAERTVLLDLQSLVSDIGARAIGDPALWHQAKQAISPAAMPLVGDHVGRILAAARGLSRKVLVLDLDNTLWGGVIGDDGVEGIKLGQGNPAGEAFAAFQRYVKRLAERGVVLAVSSKNYREVATAAFETHPEMVLRMDDFAAFEVDWNDKAGAIRRIAQQLGLGLDSFVFVDDNPAERALIRKELPQVAVPELPPGPELYGRALADAGYFEPVAFTADDAKRNRQYAANRERTRLQSQTTDIEGFLRDLDMTLTVTPFRAADIPRITQLINKTNQFNLTTRRYTEAEVAAMMRDPAVLAFTARLKDRFGDNGLTSVVIGRRAENGAAAAIEIDTWLMSCRVLGRRVEDAMLSVIAEDARGIGAEALIGRYIPTPRNGMVKDLYPRLGFTQEKSDGADASAVWRLSLANARLPPVEHVNVVRMR